MDVQAALAAAPISLTLAMMYSLKLTRSPASPLMANSLWLSTGTSLSSSCSWGR